MRLTLVGLLVLSVVCMTPLMGTGHTTTGHLHHDASASCATCMGTQSGIGEFFLLAVLGLATLMIPNAPPLPPIRDQFPPPRIA